jgi:hypothetical protein
VQWATPSGFGDLRRWHVAEPTLEKGAKGQAVKDLQEALSTLGSTPGRSA